MKKVKFIKFTMAFFACVLAVTMGSCDKNDDPKFQISSAPLLR